MSKRTQADLLGRVIAQFDTLVPYVALAHEEVFGLLKKEKAFWFDEEERSAFPASARIYKQQVAYSALLLGYSYFEAFLADLMREILRRHPALLPQNKQLTYAEILDCKDISKLHHAMIDREVHEVFYLSVDGIADYFGKRLSLTWNADQRSKAKVTSLMRNCIIHNRGRADRKLAAVGQEFRVGAEIRLAPDDIHDLGIAVRELVTDLHAQATQKHFGRPPRRGRSPHAT